MQVVGVAEDLRAPALKPLAKPRLCGTFQGPESDAFVLESMRRGGGLWKGPHRRVGEKGSQALHHPAWGLHLNDYNCLSGMQINMG